MADENKSQDDDGEEKPPIPSKEECIAMGRAAFECIQRVRMNGAIRARNDIAKYFGIDPNRFGFDRLQLLETKCKRADISHGPMYIERGLVYVCQIKENEMGFVIGYFFVCAAADWQTGDEVVK